MLTINIHIFDGIVEIISEKVQTMTNSKGREYKNKITLEIY